MLNIPTIDSDLVKAIPWTGDSAQYDLDLFALGKGLDSFMVVNPWAENLSLFHYIDKIPETDECVVWSHNGTWVAKYFTKEWYLELGYKKLEIVNPKYTWRKNPDLDQTMTFEDNPFAVYKPDLWDSYHELIWYMDPRFNPTADNVWVMSCKPIGVKVKGTKDMGYVTPKVKIEFNEDLPKLDIDMDQCYPAYWDLANECAWELDPVHIPNKKTWLFKISPAYRKPKAWVWLGTVTPEYTVIYNPDLPSLDYDLDYVIPWHDFAYEHVWMLDRKHLKEGEEDMWAFTIQVSDELVGSKIINYISPTVNIEYNESLPKLKYNEEYIVPWHDLAYEHVWYLSTSPAKEKVWAVRATFSSETIGEKEVGIVTPVFEDHLDVIFISYEEPNADENWLRVLEKAPHAKRVSGVTGIFEAHKAAAKLAKTDMFYVVDGDAWLVDDWDFDFQPGIFDRDCAYVWHSKNPINDLG